MIDADESALTAVDIAYLDFEARLFNSAVGWLEAEGWRSPPLDFYAPPDGVRRTVWAAVCYGVLCASADEFAATGSAQAKRSAQVLNGLKWTAEALARPGADRSAARAAAVNLSSAATVMIAGRSKEQVAAVTKGLAVGPKAKAEIADLTWREPLEKFMRSFLSGDPLRCELDAPIIWRAFNDAEPKRRENQLAQSRQWPSDATAHRTVNRIRDKLIAQLASRASA